MPANFVGKTATEQRIVIDGGDFTKAHLIKCTLVYKGGLVPKLAAARLENCQWSLEGPASNTLLFMAYLEKGQPDAANALMQQVRNDAAAMMKRLLEH